MTNPSIEPDWDLIEVDQLLDSAIIFRTAADRDEYRKAKDGTLVFEYGPKGATGPKGPTGPNGYSWNGAFGQIQVGGDNVVQIQSGGRPNWVHCIEEKSRRPNFKAWFKNLFFKPIDLNKQHLSETNVTVH